MDLTKMSDEELHEVLDKLREQRRTGYASPRATARRKREENPFNYLGEDVAAKILEELLKGGSDG